MWRSALCANGVYESSGRLKTIGFEEARLRRSQWTGARKSAENVERKGNTEISIRVGVNQSVKPDPLFVPSNSTSFCRWIRSSFFSAMKRLRRLKVEGLVFYLSQRIFHCTLFNRYRKSHWLKTLMRMAGRVYHPKSEVCVPLSTFALMAWRTSLVLLALHRKRCGFR